ncbi:MAG TPA: hypothetical protein PK650_12775 [Candidatus Sumerlaeota bacterium]|nr:hypothetical protein [Candidatus Sumerlaeota bacterium]
MKVGLGVTHPETDLNTQTDTHPDANHDAQTNLHPGSYPNANDDA